MQWTLEWEPYQVAKEELKGINHSQHQIAAAQPSEIEQLKSLDHIDQRPVIKMDESPRPIEIHGRKTMKSLDRPLPRESWTGKHQDNRREMHLFRSVNQPMPRS